MHPLLLSLRFSLPRVLSLTLLAGLALGIGCSPRRATTQTPEPGLCDIDGGKWCRPCTGDDCPQGDSGWLCCSGGWCVHVATTSECTTDVGWCTNFTESQQCNDSGYCTQVATCHDGA